jgi:Ser/Thr protein kinase RdoA (MazF antagonist)
VTYEASLLILDGQSQVLARRVGTTLKLPRVQVESGRVGISLSRAVRDQLGLEVFCLVLPEFCESGLYPLRLQSEGAVIPSGYFWTKPSEVIDEKTHKPSVFAKKSGEDRTLGGYFWYSEVQDWLVRQLARLGYRVQSLEQWNGRISGVLLRVSTDGPQFWFKAVSDFNAREFSIAQLLASRHPSLFPSVVASEPGWNALLLEHVEGTELHTSDDPQIWERVVRVLAQMQMQWAGDVSGLLTAGAADLRPVALQSKIPAFLEHVAEAMARQAAPRPAILQADDLSELKEQLRELCVETSALPFAEGLANADFSPHNTLITERGPAFIDWAEACVSMPLIAGEYLWNRMAVEASERKAWQERLRAAYLKQWSDVYGADVVGAAARLLPAFAVFAVAVFYHEREGHGASPYDPYLRSLARRLQRELKRLAAEEFTIHA